MGRIKAHPAREKVMAKLRELKRKPSWDECKALAEAHGANPTTVFKWSQRIYGKPGDSKPPSSPEPPQAKPPESSAESDSHSAEAPGEDSPPPTADTKKPGFRVVPRDIKPEDMPKFHVQRPPPETKGGGASPSTPTTGSPQASPPNYSDPALQAQAAIDVKPIVDVAIGIFNRNIEDVDALTGEVDPDAPPKPPQPITPEEAEQMAQAWGPFMAKHGGSIAQYSVEINAGFVALAVFAPRLIAMRQYAVWKKEQKEREPTTIKTKPEQPPADPEQGRAERVPAEDLTAPIPVQADYHADARLGEKLAGKLKGF